MNTTLKPMRRHVNPSHHATAQRRLFLEGLEGRSVLAGDVWAAAVGGNLMIHGDAEANGVHLQTMADGSVQVSGTEAGGAATTINGSTEPFVASNVRFLTRVHLGDGDDLLQVEQEVETEVAAEAQLTGSVDSSSTIVSRLRGMVNGGVAAGVNGSAGFQSRQHLLINTGNGADTVEGTVDADVDVHLTGNLVGDTISLHALTSTSADAETEVAARADVDTAAALDANLDLDPALHVTTDADITADVETSVATAVEGNVNAALDAAGRLTAGGIGLNTDLDAALTANLALDQALNSAANLGTSSLLNADQNLNGSIGGSAALNLTGDDLFDEIGLFNSSSLADIDVDLAAQLALANANNFGVAANNVDDYFASLSGQNSLGVASNADLGAGLLATLGNNDLVANGSLNTNVNANLNSAFQSRLGVPMG